MKRSILRRRRGVIRCPAKCPTRRRCRPQRPKGGVSGMSKVARLWILTAVVAGLVAPAGAADKLVRGYDGLAVTAGKPGGRLTMVLGDSPQSFFYYGVIDSNLHALAA